MSNRFEKAKQAIADIIAKSLIEEDPVHSINAWEWLLKLKPDADEILQLAILGHDLERARPDRMRRTHFPTYDEYKLKHAAKSGEMAAEIALKNGYSQTEADRLSNIIKHAEFDSDDPDINLVKDADSISYFDYNVDFYLKRSGPAQTKQKIDFMHTRMSPKVKSIIIDVVKNKPEIQKLLNQINSH